MGAGTDAVDADTEAAIEELLAVEQEFQEAVVHETYYERGTIERASKGAADQMPDGYPLEVTTDEVLRVEVAVAADTTVVTYLEWPERGDENPHVTQLLDAIGVPPDSFADVYGREVGLSKSDGWHYLDFERTRLLQSSAAARWNASPWWLVVLGGLVGTAWWSVAPLTGDPTSIWLLLVASAALSMGMAADGKRLGDVTPWRANTYFWAVSGLIPTLNVGFGAAYLIERYVRLRERPMGASNVWRAGLLVGIVMQVLGYVRSVDTLLYVGHVLVVAGVYYLAYHLKAALADKIREGEYFDATSEASFVGALAAITGAVGGTLYLLVTREH